MPRLKSKQQEKKYRKRPNGAGTVTKLSGNRRKPFVAKVTVEKDYLSGMQKQKPIGYFETEEDAINALSIHNMLKKKQIKEEQVRNLNPSIYDALINQKNNDAYTFTELFNILDENFISTLSPSAQRIYKACFKRLKPLHNRKLFELSLNDLQTALDNNIGQVSRDNLFDIRRLIIRIYNQGIIEGEITKNDDYTQYISIPLTKETKDTMHIPFSIPEIKKLMNDGSIEAKIILIYIYTGARPSELLNLHKSKIHIDEISNDDGEKKQVSYIVTGSKTDAGKDRIIPIHNYIKPFILEILGKQDTFLPYTQKVPYEAYKRNIFDILMKKYNMKHLPHDTRHTFATLAEKFNLDVYSNKKILGHKFQDLTKDTYTHTIINKLYDEIQKIQL